ncbi:NAD(P)H-dependent glycerol-3-phosphate dehydrogenase [Salinibacter ruber]|uniref:Glycerol-3-phosphate dehydrogenase [NAD(P)+] 1 n=1 Tax=Salinibacter ruber (strain DSM 13855 / M31) TaxID=309807 RepID=GPDA1_SALRD|nr:NAD(P)H-dependent glycerol-3-phosphate dehydrogenase [Salinibacter ruber]Q2S2I4.1 RecName: Full=Glycerol-3-phosphate dehydrogenase [NAD(P)+] 1; AltName: Full=NAD(P)H-dependent glycerol-3-phosphate dehydrogenase 1 [Salinibacter ruber DSM 13855]ABC43573.1 NAD-dependent glycerol-3-phosphate dehydrogenase C-terminus family [Salinibacter ruber DSM 13855]
MSSITLFGAGSWGTAMSVHLASAGRDVVLWARRPEVADEIRRTSHNPTYLPELLIPSSVYITTDLEKAAEASDLWGMAVPSQQLRGRAEHLRPHAHSGVRLVALSKGIENETLLTMSQVLDDVFESVPSDQIGALYGPSHAEEVAEGRPTAVVAAAPDEGEARHIQKVFMTERLRVYMNTDVLGVEIGGSAKNVLAIAAGIADGVSYGDNAKAALVTRGLAEIRRLGQALGADPQTFAGLAGIGDLVVTCMSPHSRNRYLGEQISTGKSLDEVLNDMAMVAEGVRTTRSVYNLAKHHGVEMPITEAVHAILFDDKSPRKMVKRLMTRSAKHENWLPTTLQQ